MDTVHSHRPDASGAPDAAILPHRQPAGSEPWQDGGEALRRAVSTLRRNWPIIVGCTVVALALALVATLLMKPIYSARATFEVQSDAPQVSQIEGMNDTRPDGAFLQTQIALLNSRALSLLVVDRLKLNDNAEFMGDDVEDMQQLAAAAKKTPALARARRQAAAARVRSGIEAKVLTDSSVIEVKYSNADPKLAAAIANTIVEQFFLSSVERRFAASNYTRDFLAQRLSQLKTRLENSERELIGYAGASGMLTAAPAAIGTGAGTGSVGASQSIDTVGLPALVERVAEARAQRIIAEENWRMASTRAGANLPTLRDDAQVVTLTTQLTALQAEYEQKRQTFQPGYGPMEQLHGRIQMLESEIARLRDQKVSGLRATYQLTVQQEQALEKQLTTVRDAVFDTQNRGVRYATLQREVQTNRALYDALLQRFKEIGVSNGGSNRFAIVDNATPPGAPDSPILSLNLLIALIAGLGIGAGIAFVKDAVEDRVSSPTDVTQKLNLPLLGITPVVQEEPDDLLHRRKSMLHEAYFSIETAIRQQTPGRLPRSLLVASTDVGEGKSTTAIGIASSLSERGQRTVLVDADMRKPSLHRRLGVENIFGLSTALGGEKSALECVAKAQNFDFDVLVAGPLTPNPAQMLAMQFARVLEDLKNNYDIVVIDSAPVLGLADAPILANLADGCVYVVEAGRNRPASVRTAIQRLGNSFGLLYGVVMTKVGQRDSGYDYTYKSYRYDYGN